MENIALRFDKIARTVLAHIYPVIAEQIIAYTGVIRVTCLDISCGSGYRRKNALQSGSEDADKIPGVLGNGWHSRLCHSP